MTRYKGVLFDFDGTLACTMEDNFQAWRAVTKRYGLDLKPTDYYPYEGLPLEELALRFFKGDSAMAPAPNKLVQLKDEHYLRNHRFNLYPGVESFIDSLRGNGIRMAIVTAGLKNRLERSVPEALLRKFDALITGEMTAKGKPHPEPYLKGASELGLRSQECIVVENSPLGVNAGKSAKSYCVAICSTLDCSYFKEADAVVNCFEDLPSLEVIQQMLGSVEKSVTQIRS